MSNTQRLDRHPRHNQTPWANRLRKVGIPLAAAATIVGALATARYASDSALAGAELNGGKTNATVNYAEMQRLAQEPIPDAVRKAARAINAVVFAGYDEGSGVTVKDHDKMVEISVAHVVTDDGKRRPTPGDISVIQPGKVIGKQAQSIRLPIKHAPATNGDIALLEVDDLGPYSAPVAAQPPQPGDRLWAIGMTSITGNTANYSTTNKPTFTPEIYLGKGSVGDGAQGYMMTPIVDSLYTQRKVLGIQAGDSGSALVNEKGELVGIDTAVRTDSTLAPFAGFFSPNDLHNIGGPLFTHLPPGVISLPVNMAASLTRADLAALEASPSYPPSMPQTPVG